MFQGRFDNELVAGALQSDSAMAIKGLTGILNGDTGAALAADNVMLQASAGNFIGNAGDIGGNNIAIGGATYVGSGTTFTTTTSVNGIAMGTGAPAGANPNIANGTGGTPATPHDDDWRRHGWRWHDWRRHHGRWHDGRWHHHGRWYDNRRHHDR